MQGVILAAGFGTRLWPLTVDRTKPAIPFLGKPLITYSVEYLASYRINDITINLHHQPESVRNAIGYGSSFGVQVRYSLEEEILGTSGALDRMRDWLSQDDFIVINGKIITDVDLAAAVRDHQESGAIATLVLRPNTARERFSIVETDGHSRVTGFDGFPEPVTPGRSIGDSGEAPDEPRKRHDGDADAPGTGRQQLGGAGVPLMFTGIQVLSPRIFGYIPRDRFSHSTVDVYPQAIRAGETVLAHVSDANWFELSTLERYLAASLTFIRKQGGDVVKGSGSRIDPGAVVTDSVLWDRVNVEAGARVRFAIVGDDVTVPAGSDIRWAAVVRREIVTDLERGQIVGDNVVVPLNQNYPVL
ncbi:MAG TPA: NDP-sugar synthase [Blastocatellia bacterium]